MNVTNSGQIQSVRPFSGFDLYCGIPFYDETTADISGSRLGIMAMCKTIPQITAKSVYTHIITRFVSFVNRYWKSFSKKFSRRKVI